VHPEATAAGPAGVDGILRGGAAGRACCSRCGWRGGTWDAPASCRVPTRPRSRS